MKTHNKIKVTTKLNRGIAKAIVERTGLSPSYICEIFTGSKALDTYSTALNICEVADIDPVLLLTGNIDVVIKEFNRYFQSSPLES